jgi:hypothetical protein
MKTLLAIIVIGIIAAVIVLPMALSGRQPSVSPPPSGYTYVLVPDSLVGYQACINYHYPPSAEFQDGEWSWVNVTLK